MNELRQSIRNAIANYYTIKNGGAGSGNWGHAGRPGKVGGSAKGHGTPTAHQKERRSYGMRLRQLAETFGATNTGKKYQDKYNKAVAQAEKQKREEEVSGKMVQKFYHPDSTNYQKGDQRRTTKMIQREREKAQDPNYKPEFKTLVTTPRGAKLIEKDGKVAWVMGRMIRADGTLTAGGLKALKEGQTSEEYYKKQEHKQEIIQEHKNEKEKEKQGFKELYNWDVDKDTSDEPFIKMKESMAYKYPTVLKEIASTEFKTPENIQNILDNDYTAKLTANYWQTPDGSKKRIYFNVYNDKGYKYPLKESFITVDVPEPVSKKTPYSELEAYENIFFYDRYKGKIDKDRMPTKEQFQKYVDYAKKQGGENDQQAKILEKNMKEFYGD